MMKGITILLDEQTGKRCVQIDVDVVAKYRKAVSEQLDTILLNHRRNALTVTLDQGESRPKKSKAK